MIDNAHWLELQKRLGPQGRMGIAARFFDSGGGLQDEVTFNARQLFPMASIAKIAIAMLVAAGVENLELSLDDTIPIDSRLLSPGLARSPIDHLFFYPFETGRIETLDRLLGFMIHRSDNTSSDVLVQKIGGVPALKAFVEACGIRGMHFTRTFGQIVSYYYDLRLPANRRPHIGQILATIPKLMDPYTSRETREDELLQSGNYCCTPVAMADLLTLIIKERKYAIAYSHMQRCAGGLNRIRKGLADQMNRIETFGHKTGSLGGIANDAGVIKFIDGSSAAICIMTCRSSVPMEVRDQQIASAARLCF
jgi:beta-lactamase class A